VSEDAPPLFRPEDLSETWHVVWGTAEGERLRTELDRELAVRHVLHGKRADAVAVRQNFKESIWWLPDEAAWAVVHLTWSTETDPSWPMAVLVENWTEVVAELAERGHP
jgi:hypothetical protein